MTTPIRRPYTGSCHCGATKFIAFLTLPHTPPPVSSILNVGQRFYRCNCTVCHKSGLFHIRLANAVSDFLLLSPLDPNTEFGDYRCNMKIGQFFFCKTCGGRCLTFLGEGEVVDVDLKELGVGDEALKRLGVEGDGKVKAWRPKEGVFNEGTLTEEDKERGMKMSYLGINGFAVDAGQEGLELRELTEKKWVCYLNMLTEEPVHSYDGPRDGGAY
jgi:hypothetical protein